MIRTKQNAFSPFYSCIKHELVGLLVGSKYYSISIWVFFLSPTLIHLESFPNTRSVGITLFLQKLIDILLDRVNCYGQDKKNYKEI